MNELISITFNHEKFEELKKEFWKAIGLRDFRCDKHNTLFNNEEEPCWECWNECEETVE